MNRLNKILLAVIIILTICLSGMTYFYIQAKIGYASLERTYMDYSSRK